MPLQFILGKPGTGKTTYCLQEIYKRIDGDAPLYYLVPEQFSLQSEKLILTNRAAATKVQVLSFNRLAHRLFSYLGGPPGKMVDDLGKQMLLRKVLFEVSDRLTYYKSAIEKHGFVDTLLQTMTEMNQYRIAAEDLTVRAVNSSAVFAAKLTDISVISRAYRGLVTDRYLQTDDMLEILCKKIEETDDPLPLLDGAYFWVDGFSGFTPQERLVLNCLLKRASNMYVTLTTTSDSRLSMPIDITMEQLKATAPSVRLEENYRHVKSKGLAGFVQNFKIFPQKQPITGIGEGIEIISAVDRYAAANTAASQILDLVRVEGYRFKDIAILCGDRENYEKILQTTFDRLNIPLFVDSEIDILSHPLTELIRASLDIVVKNWNYESVFRFLKTRLTGLPVETIDILENYVLEHGVGSFRWRYKFANQAAESARLELLAMLPKARADFKDTVENHCRRIFDMLYALNVPKTLEKWYEAHMHSGDHATANLHKQIWPKICEVFDKLVEMLGDEKVTVKTFAATLDAGFSQVGLGRVPPTTDQVILGDVGRSRYPEIKAMIVLGANENALPPAPSSAGLLSEQERKMLNNTGLELGKENIHRLTEGYYSLYLAMAQPKEKLILIYSEAEPGGKPLRPSPVIARLQELFPGLPVTSAPAISDYGMTPPAAETTGVLQSADKLYGDSITTAASRLESFARCPFQYFMTYILKAKERKRFEVLPTDLGNLFHLSLAHFAKEVWQNDKKELSKNEISTLVDNIVENITIDTDLYNDTARNRHVLTKARRMLTASIWALNEHIKMGDFSPKFVEHEVKTDDGIALENGKKLFLAGIVDRVDSFEDYIKIIDYKSGNVKFNMDDVKKGVQLQLMIYMNMLTKTLDAKPGGIFYFPLSDPLLETDVLLDETTLEAGLLKQYKMSGIALAEEKTLAALDKTLSSGTSSPVIPVAVNKDGSYKKTAQPTVLGLDSFLALGKEVDNKIIELGNRMTKGDISAAPYTTGQKSPCRFCKFGAVCGRL